MPGYSQVFYELVEFKPRRNLLTRNRDKAVAHFKGGGKVRRGICHQYQVGGKWYPEGINYWEEFRADGKEKISC